MLNQRMRRKMSKVKVVIIDYWYLIIIYNNIIISKYIPPLSISILPIITLIFVY